jgi:hypothetical protein
MWVRVESSQEKVTVNVRSRSQSTGRGEIKKLCQFSYEELNSAYAYELKASLLSELVEVPPSSLKAQILQLARAKWVDLGYTDEGKRKSDLAAFLNSRRASATSCFITSAFTFSHSRNSERKISNQLRIIH